MRGRHCFIVGAFGSALLVGIPASAQTQREAGGHRVEVTGSLIRRIDTETALPVTTLRSQELQRAGVSNAEQAVQFITQQQGGTVTTASVSTTNGGAAYADLRRLGHQRTLVLLNGRRLVNNPFASAAVDLNTLPMAAVDRVEILSDGASATYGTDAIAGVINFITRQQVRGGAVDAMAQATQHGGGNVYAAGLLGGVGDVAAEGWNVFASLNLRRQEPLRGTDRDFARSSYIPGQGFNATSPTTFPANYSQSTGGTTLVPAANPSAPGCAPPTSLGLPDANGDVHLCAADTQSYTHTVPAQDQASLFVRAAAHLGKGHRAFAEVFHAVNRLDLKVAPSPESGLTMYPDSPFFPGRGITPATHASLDPHLPISLGWRTTALGTRDSRQRNHTRRLVLGLEGTVGPWDYDTAVMWSHARITNEFLNGFPMTQPLRDGVRSCSARPAIDAGGTVTCAAPLLDPDGQRIHLNPFGDQTPAGLAYLQSRQVLGRVQDGEGTLGSWTAAVRRDVLTLPGGPLSAAVGFELRSEDMVHRTDVPLAGQASSSGLAGAAPLREGERLVRALAVEARFPLLRSLEVDAALRLDRYSDFGDTVNPKLSMRVRPVEPVLLRASVNTGFSAPTLTLLHMPQATTATSTRFDDPVLCPGREPVPGQGIRSRDCGQQFQRLVGGNPQLTPETSRARTWGVVVQPGADWTVGLDYWDVLVRNVIGSLGEQTVFGDPSRYASLFVRCSQAPQERRALIGNCQVPGGGDPLAYIVDNQQNLGDVRSTGVDLQLSFRSPVSPQGRFSVGLRGTYVRRYQFQLEKDGAWLDALGDYQASFGGPVIRYQQVLTLGWERGRWSSLLTWRHLNGYRDQNAPASVAPAFRNHVVDNHDPVHWSVTYSTDERTTWSLSVLNLFDEAPPFSNQSSRFQARGYDDRFASPLGRTFQVAVRGAF